MVIYEVTAVVPEPLRERYEHYMLTEHIPDVVSTGFFTASQFTRSSPGRYRIYYHCASQADLDRYLAEEAAEKRRRFFEHFPEGVELSREVWVECGTGTST